MEHISKVLQSVINKHDRTIDPQQLFQTAMKDPEVQAFLRGHRQDLTPEIIQRSQANLYAFYVQKRDLARGHAIIAGYEPHLFLNGSVIDLTYRPTQELRQAQAKQAQNRRLHLIDLPESLRQADFSSLDVQAGDGRYDAIAAAASFPEKFKQNAHARGFYLSGDFGVGKTFILAAMANRLTAQGAQVVFLHVPTFIASLGSKIKAGTVNAEIRRLSTAQILIFDDIGAESLSQWSRDDVLGVILQSRMDNQRPTFFSSNFDQATLGKHFAETKDSIDPVKAKRLLERVRMLAPEIVVAGPNRRQ
ncbi:MAG: primosomal protein DnaI [Lactobacillus sp.]|jgi:primosomal protein DnaI|nr:primosomal protein DnaI [Lactobacillus sp.]MCH3906049.1 primosomal protein DnaI [Lactobacillus sp.]MCI1883853.1 primosomal protein DnaI [Lactobacillus sp.]MCI1916209.1 primosomal protein DnaI [Lactobacillus sp.]MCI1943485.1 primosomal protein DnaI [Lactobacillus sp.]